jgi:DNA helicase-2/ATP-dependent DNA helicase PcrA
MEYDTPSRFIRDIDPQLLRVESQKGGDDDDEDYGTHRLPWTRRSDSTGSEWMQNPRPVATQFRADPKPRAAAPRRPEAPVDPFSDRFRQQLNQASGGRFRPVSRPAAAPSAPAGPSSLREGCVIEHQRFGIGTVVKVEGTGENEKATVEFRNAGTKQLLLKFAKFKIVG